MCRSVLQKSIDVVGNVSVLKLGAVALNRLTVLVDQELFEVPGDVRAADRRPLDGHRVGLDRVDEIGASTAAVILRGRDRVLEVCPEGLLVLAVHGALGHDLELGLVAITGADVLEGVHELKI